MLPIFDRLEDCPAEGDCWLRERDGCVQFVRDRKLTWYVNSVAGWATRVGPVVVQEEVALTPIYQATEMIACSLDRDPHIFAATAEEAIATYHADESKCPWGALDLVPTDYPEYKKYAFRDRKGDGNKRFVFTSEDGRPLGDGFPLKAMRSLIDEVIAYQEAHAAGHPETSAIGRHIAQMQAPQDRGEKE
jgi:hypothetical protein